MTFARRQTAVICLAVALSHVATTFAAQPKAKPRPAPKPPTPAAPTAPTAPPSTTSIEVTVIQLAGTQAYVQPGASGGVHRGARVVVNHKEYPVVQTTDSFAVIEVGSEPPHEQDKGQASVVGAEEQKAKELPKPQPLSTWEHAWTEAEAPASSQTPRFVPLGGGTERDRRWDVRLSMTAGGTLPIHQPGAGIASGALNARVHAEPFEAPTAFDLDVSLQGWAASNLDARDGASTRPIVWLRELLVSQGIGSWRASLGRMRYAASTLGTLDGARAHTPLGEGFSVGAFGGLLPNPLGGEPSLDAQRFGVETTYSRPDVDLRPEAALVVHGSTFRGGLDERRVSGVFGLYPGLSRIGGNFEVSNFDSTNPWKAGAIELTAAGLDGSVRAGILQFGGRFDVRQPERSRWLGSFLPASWLCRTVPAPVGAPAGPEPCDGSVSTRALGALDAGVQIDNVSFVVGGTTIGDLTQTGDSAHMLGGFASGRVVHIQKIVRVDVSGSYSNATYLNMYGGTLGSGVTLFDDVLDLSAYYRNATLQYRSNPTSLVQHGIGAAAMLFPSSDLLFTLQGEAILGSDVQALTIFGTAMWRPRP